jgi:HEAT repeat protein
MAKAQTTEAKVARLKALRDDPHSPAALGELKKALHDRSNYVVSRAAEIIGEFEIRSLIADLLVAFGRFMVDPAKTDPQCLAKTALAETLHKMEHDDREFFLRGMRHFQPEAVWGGQQDSAANLRGICALGLVQCPSGDALEVLNSLVDLLADPEKPARIDTARALGYFSRREGIPLLRLKIRTGDEEPEVVGACFSGLLQLSAQESIPFVAGFLQSGDLDIRLEAAAALGESREVQAFEALKNCWENQRDSSFKKSLLLSIGLSRQPAAQDFLLSLVRSESLETAADAIAALAPCRFQATTREKVEAAVRATGQAALQRVFEKAFGANST